MISEKINILKTNLPKNVTLVAVSKTKSSEIILEANSKGHLDFGENKVQELVQKHEVLPKNIRWHKKLCLIIPKKKILFFQNLSAIH